MSEDSVSETASTGTDAFTPISCICCKKKSCHRLWCGFNSYYQLLILFLLVFFYLLIGGGIFTAVERPNELRTIEETQVARNNAFNSFVEVLVNSTNLTEQEALNLTTGLIELGQIASQFTEAETNPIWDYASAVFFASTVITTIGYGTIAPSTAAGQILFIFYAIIGIPLALIFLSQIGAIISAWLDRILKPLEQRRGASTAHAAGVLIIFSVTLVFFVLIPAAIFSSTETWNYRESVYYTMVTLTTVGFGDFVPARGDSSTGTRFYRMMTAAWIWIGLALVAALISETQDFLKGMGRKCRSHPKVARLFETYEKTLEKQELARVDSKEVSPVSPTETTSPPAPEEESISPEDPVSPEEPITASEI